ncbi:hypothetical protein VAPA_1c06390 [Variovorax paradoxus B4]|uniref:Uncharacterized protein n=1 Tax=Variovorax paradoxus B4 TaxID=1246301 RepID=T1X606_VARPD|nr:hypothetical protein VAPA_1c06390 [Variovorax paradoxus B4]
MCQRPARRMRSMRDQSARVRPGRPKTFLGRPKNPLQRRPARPCLHRKDASAMRSMHPINGVDRT